MKKLFFVITAVLMFIAVGCAPKGFTIVGNVQGLEGTVKLQDGDDIVAEAEVTEGHFTMKGNLEAPGIFYLWSSNGRLSLVFVEPGDKLTFTGEINTVERRSELRVAGSVANDAHHEYVERNRELVNRMRQADSRTRSELQRESTRIIEEVLEKNRDNLYGLHLLNNAQRNMAPGEVIERLDALPARLQNTRVATEMRSRAEARIRTEVGKPFIEIVLPDKDGNEISLSSVLERGRYVLIDFWAAWCGPCMTEVPHLIEAYEAFDFEIYAVSLDNDREKWLGAIERHNMNWINVSRITGWDNPYVKEYAVSGIPANFLISPDGKIVAHSLRGNALKEKLAELLQ